MRECLTGCVRGCERVSDRVCECVCECVYSHLCVDGEQCRRLTSNARGRSGVAFKRPQRLPALFAIVRGGFDHGMHPCTTGHHSGHPYEIVQVALSKVTKTVGDG